MDKDVQDLLNQINNTVVQSHHILRNLVVQVARQVNENKGHIGDLMKLVKASEYMQRFPKFSLVAERAIAIESDDHRFPRGTVNDNTRYPRLVEKARELFGEGSSILDLGCAGGGLVADFLFSGYPAVGLEGSDVSLRTGRAEWTVIPDFLFTCDIVKPFTLSSAGDGSPHRFAMVSAWEVLEHIPEQHLPQLFANIRNHLADDGYFIASVAQFEDKDPTTGAQWHVTIKPRDWWYQKLDEAGFKVVHDVFHIKDFPRGSGNGPDDWDGLINPHVGFHVAAQKVG